jgi:NADPH:quinone reductase-like Zn-dependent oxidoreductase
MRAVVVVAGDRPSVEIAQLPVPEPGPRQALVRVSAAGLNRADLLQLLGRYPAPRGAPPAVLGIEFAGVVEQLGPQCSRTAVGRRVFGLASGGAHADYIVSPEELLVDVPETLGDAEAAATAEAFITVHDALVTQAGMRSGERVLVHAAASGVGWRRYNSQRCRGP